MREALEDAKDAEAGGQGDMPGGLNNMFGPTFLGRLSMDPRTRPYLEQQDFLAMLQTLQKNPGAMQMYMGDPRFKMAMQVGNVIQAWSSLATRSQVPFAASTYQLILSACMSGLPQHRFLLCDSGRSLNACDLRLTHDANPARHAGQPGLYL